MPRKSKSDFRSQPMTEVQTQKQQVRLSEGRCPIHGLPMSQISRWFEDSRKHYCFGGCPRKDCSVAAKFHEPFGQALDVAEDKWKIESENRWQYLSLLEEDEQIGDSGYIEKLRAAYARFDQER